MRWSNGQPPSSLRGLAFHFQLVQSSLILKIVTFHLCNENFTAGDRLGESFCRWGPKSWRVPHTSSRSFALFPCLTTAASSPAGQSGTWHWQLWRAFCSRYTLQDGKGSQCVIKSTVWVCERAAVPLPSSGFLLILKPLQRPVGGIHLKAWFPHPGKPASLERLQWQTREIPGVSGKEK